MNTSIKILMTINLESSVLVRQDQKEYIKYSITKQDLSKEKLPKDIGKQVVKVNKIPHYPLVTKSCTQHIKISKEAYNHFISDYCPEKNMLKVWKKMPKNQRLDWHLNKMCEFFRGNSYDYEILED